MRRRGLRKTVLSRNNVRQSNAVSGTPYVVSAFFKGFQIRLLLNFSSYAVSSFKGCLPFMRFRFFNIFYSFRTGRSAVRTAVETVVTGSSA